MAETTNVSIIEIIRANLEQKVNELENIIENKINGSILRSKASIVEYSERNRKYFTSLEKKRSEFKLIPRLQINDKKKNTNQDEILEAAENFYRKLYEKKETQISAYNFLMRQ